MTAVRVLLPVLGRPHRVVPLLASLFASERDLDLRPLFLVSPNDAKELDEVMASGCDYKVVEWHPGAGDFARKTNLGFAITSEEWVFLGADDLDFKSEWATSAITIGRLVGAGVIGTQDLGNPKVQRGLHSTHPLVHRPYIEEYGGTFDGTPGIVYCEEYDHQCVDNELVEVATRRGKFAFAQGSVVEHLHPFWHKGKMDGTYRKALAKGKPDIRRFRERQALWQ